MNIFNRRNNILVLGSSGMLGHEVINVLKCMSLINGYGNCIGKVSTVLHDDLDITQRHALENYINTYNCKFDYVVNCAAYTNTRLAETSENEKSYAVNALGCKYIAEDCAKYKIKLIHVSTDYIFNGRKPNPEIDIFSGFTPDDVPNPANAYGYHKLMGEMFIQTTMKPGTYTILRTSWLYGDHGKKSFVHKITKKLFDETQAFNREDDACTCINVSVDNTEHSVPTSTDQLAYMIFNAIKYNITGIHHACGTSNHFVTRAQWASEILKNIKSNMDTAYLYKNICGILSVKSTTSDIPRPECSFMVDNTKERSKLFTDIETDWRYALNKFISKHSLSFKYI